MTELVRGFGRRLGEERTRVVARVGDLNDRTRSAVRTAAAEARDSISELEYELSSGRDGPRILLEGEASALRSYQREFQNALLGHDVSVNIDVDPDVQGSLVIEVVDTDDEPQGETELDSEEESD